MTDAINAINSSAVKNTSSSSSGALSEDTKKKLEALGIDTSNITKETQGKSKLKEAQAAAHAQGHGQKPQSASSMQAIKTEVDALAAKMGVSVGTNDKIDDIFRNISAKISSLQSAAGTDKTKSAEVESYQAEYASISSEYTQMQASQSMLGKSLNALASYNKAALGLS